MRRSQYVAVFIVVVGLMAAGTPRAQTTRSGAGGEQQKFMQQYQQVAAEKTALQGQVAQMKKELDAVKSDLAAAKKERDAIKARSGGTAAAVTQATASKVAAEQQVEQSKQRMNELVGRFRETAQSLKDVESDRAAARKELAERNRAFDTCAESNVQLYEIADEVLKKYEHVGFFTKASAGEPITRLTRTQIENLVDQYRARAQELRVAKPTK